MRINKFIIGTAKFGMKYGFYKKETSLKQVEKILLYAKKSGINILDTALTYNNAFDKLAKVGVKDWSIISKIPSLPKEVKDIKAWVYKITFLTLEKLKISKIDTMLIHDEENVINLKIGKKLVLFIKTDFKSSSQKKIENPVYIVKEGDTLWDIANKYEGVSVSELIRHNNLNTNQLKPGEKIILPTG